MEIKDIRQYIELFMKGESTLQERFEMLRAHRQILQQKNDGIGAELAQNDE